MSHIVDSIKRGDAATIASIKDACARFRGDALAGGYSAEDVVADAMLRILSGEADTIHRAARLAFAAHRAPRREDGDTRYGFQYLSAVVGEGEDGEDATVGSRLADSLADTSEGGRDPLATLSTLAVAAGAARVRKGYAAHGAVMARGEANAYRGAANDADILRALEAVGGRHYGYAAKIVGYLAAEGKTTTANAVRVAIHRALGRTERGKHSARD